MLLSHGAQRLDDGRYPAAVITSRRSTVNIDVMQLPPAPTLLAGLAI